VYDNALIPFTYNDIFFSFWTTHGTSLTCTEPVWNGIHGAEIALNTDHKLRASGDALLIFSY